LPDEAIGGPSIVLERAGESSDLRAVAQTRVGAAVAFVAYGFDYETLPYRREVMNRAEIGALFNRDSVGGYA
jgi:hypothetical protein